MSRLYALTRRELLAYFYAPEPYLVTFLYLFLTWFVVHDSLGAERVRVDYQGIFYWLDFLLLFLVPLLTMGSVAEERSRNTIETLLTAPVGDWQVILSKWMGTFAFYVVMLAPTLVYWLVLRVLAGDTTHLDGGPIVAAYVGALLLGGFYIAIGIFASSLTENARLSAFLAFFIMLVLMAIQLLRDHVSDTLRQAVDYLAQHDHFTEFLRGKIAMYDVLYFVTMTTFFLFLSVRALESRKWR